MTLDPFGAFVRMVSGRGDPDPVGPLAGLTFAVKDNIDVRGLPTGNGNPQYADWRGLPERDATVVTTLHGAGAKCIAKTHMHELAYGLTGVNMALGTPKNPFRPGRIPGGSSSGSAVATAAQLVDFAIGTDTGGSVRVPAAFCGVYGYRPTHGSISLDGVVSLADSFDTVGVFARTAALLERVAATLLSEEFRSIDARATSIIVFNDIDSYTGNVLQIKLADLVADLVRLGYQLGEVEGMQLLNDARAAQTVIQGAEAYAYHEKWIHSATPQIGADVLSLIETARALSDADVHEAGRVRDLVADSLAALLSGGKVLLLPTCPGDPPTLEDLSDPQMAMSFRASILNLSNLASLVGYPVVSVPTPGPSGEGVGVQLIAEPGNDLLVLRLARELANAV